MPASFASHRRSSSISAETFMAPTPMESARQRYPKRLLADFFYNRASLGQERRKHLVNLSSWQQAHELRNRERLRRTLTE